MHCHAGHRMEFHNVLLTRVLLYPPSQGTPLEDMLLPAVLQHPLISSTVALYNVTLVTRCDMLQQYISLYNTTRSSAAWEGVQTVRPAWQGAM